jgi:hypothetical protein
MPNTVIPYDRRDRTTAAHRETWGPVGKDQRGAGRQAAHEPIPHHPATRREIEEPLVRLQIRVELMFLQMLNERPAGAVHDALWHAGRA